MAGAPRSDSILDDLELRPVSLSESDFVDPRLFLGKGDAAVEVVVATARSEPPPPRLRSAWKARVAGRAAPVLLVVLHPGGCALCAPSAGDSQVWLRLDLRQVERLCRAALAQPNRHAALRLLAGALPEVDSPTPGLRNEGLFATHELRVGVPRRPDWGEALGRSGPLLGLRDRKLVQALGFEIRPLPGAAAMLVTAGGAQAAVAVFLDESEAAEIASPRFGGLSPVLYALAKADQAEVRYVVVSGGAGLRLYTTLPGAGVGQRGRTETYAEVRLDLLRADQAAYLWLLFSADALAAKGSVTEILDSSRRYAVDLGARLRDRIYAQVVPRLAEAIFSARGLKSPTAEDLNDTYRMALAVLFRLLFIAYAEDRDLLPFRFHDAYRRRALKTKAREILERLPGVSGAAAALWPETQLLFRAVDRGRPEWGVPAYNGGLFSEDAEVSAIGAKLSALILPEDSFARAVEDLLIDKSTDERGPVDFRSLGVREFGTIYEGLLESSLSLAETDLAVDHGGRYRQAEKGDQVVVEKGAAYLGTPSGERKATGTYFTPDFAVEHLLDHALEPALADHVARLNALEERSAAETFFDFRVADLAMGSAHFLVAAIDRIERRLSSYLVERPLPGVLDELARLRARAIEALGPTAVSLGIEDAQLIRRQIARRCIYGVDFNDDAVDLARLAIWVHTFVPGLPLSVLDHHILCGNSLVGIATLDEAFESIEPLFRKPVEKVLDDAKEAAVRLGRLAEADAAEVREARKALAEARKVVSSAAALFDLLVAARLKPAAGRELETILRAWRDDPKRLPGSKLHEAALLALRPLEPFHPPLVFPEVFLRERRGFDVILGNPPWEEATLEEDDYWSRWDPGFQGLPQHERERRMKEYRKRHPDRGRLFEEEKARAEALRAALTSGVFPGMGTGDPDTYKAFAWRFWQLCARPGGRIGVVLPRSAWAAKGSTEWRRKVLTEAQISDLTFVLNTGGWVFADAEPRYTIALVAMNPGAVPTTLTTAERAESYIPLRGPFASEARYRAGLVREAVRLPTQAILDGSDTAALPLLPSEDSAEVWVQMKKGSRLDLNVAEGWRARPYAELHATNEKTVMKFAETRPDGYWPVYKGESFDIWQCDTGSYYAWAEPEKIQRYLQEKRRRARKTYSSPFAEFDAAWVSDPRTLPCLHPRIAFRDVSRATDSRTVRAALIPAKVVITNKGPYFLWPRGDEKDQTYLLGVMCSIPLDWFARRHVEVNLNYFILNPLPVPRPGRTDTRWQRVVALAGRLAAQDRRFRSWAKAVGVDCGRLAEDEKEELVAELDAVVAQLYGLTETQVRHVFETFHEGWDYGARLEAVLRHFVARKKRA